MVSDTRATIFARSDSIIKERHHANPLCMMPLFFYNAGEAPPSIFSATPEM